MARRKTFTKKDRARIFAAHDGKCHLCKQEIKVGEAWELEHLIAWELTRDDSDENLGPAHKACHKVKTHEVDRPAIQKAKDREAKHKGFDKPQGKLQGPSFRKSTKTPAIDKSVLPPLQRRHYATGEVIR